MNRILIIYNPKANRGRNVLIADELQKHVMTQTKNGVGNWDVTWETTTHPGHATELTLQAAQNGYQRIVSMGGDGTLHEIVNGLLRVPESVRPQLGVVPLGSGNDFVKGARMTQALSIPINDAVHAFEIALTQQSETARCTFDVGYLRLGNPLSTPQFWCNVLGIGFDAAVTLQSQRINWLRGQAMYFLAAMRTIIENYDAPHLTIELDAIQLSQPVQMLTIGNGTREGGGFITTPAAVVDDGLLNYAMFRPVSRPMMLRLIPEVMQGTHGRFKQVRMGTFKRMMITSDRPLLIHADGEMITHHDDGVRVIEIGVVPNAIELVHPA